MKVKRLIIRIDEEKCDGCGACIPACPEGALAIVDGKAKLVRESLCDGIGACIGMCPKGAITLEERYAEPFDESLAIEHVKHANVVTSVPVCPSVHETYSSDTRKGIEHGSDKLAEILSELSHWPIQLALLSPMAQFLRNCDLLLAADCVPFAYPLFHQTMLKGKALAVACPKLDDARAHIEKLAAIFSKNSPNSVTIAHMEVPCCHGLVYIAERAMEMARISIPIRRIMVSVRGEILENEG
ncbi:MAG: 4Fe-4S binding protein [Armatimonadota bacterium]|nr:4Fe-4S binding protein [Armatimonadota bacterium]MDW8026553.1 4Fe-4S binding protein [Armatimonadota bacterium]